MKRLVLVLCVGCAMATNAYAGPEEGSYFSSGVTKDAPTPSAYATVTADKKLFLEAGERRHDSATDSYVAVRQEANASIISKTTAVTIGGGVAGDTHLMGLLIHTALEGTCAITGFADSDGAAQTYTLPAGSVGYKDFLGAINSAGALTITCSTANDDNRVMVLWRPR